MVLHPGLCARRESHHGARQIGKAPTKRFSVAIESAQVVVLHPPTTVLISYSLLEVDI